jgi:hypothetical protein
VAFYCNTKTRVYFTASAEAKVEKTVKLSNTNLAEDFYRFPFFGGYKYFSVRKKCDSQKQAFFGFLRGFEVFYRFLFFVKISNC